MHFLHQEGRPIFKFAVKELAEISSLIMEKHDIGPDDITLFVPHQANRRIIKACQQRLRFRDEQVFINIDSYGNTTSATIPICLFEASQEGRIRKGDYVLLGSVGAGFTWGSALLRWEC